MPPVSPVPTAAAMAAAIRELERSRDAVAAECAALTAAEWARTDGVGRWTAGQTLEHIALVEARMPKLFEGMLQQPPDPDWTATLALDGKLASAAVPDAPAVSPEPLRPTGGPAPEQLLADFAASRAAVLDFARRPGLPLLQHTRKHIVYGPLNGYQWLLLTAYHTDRHLCQIRRCLAAGVPA